MTLGPFLFAAPLALIGLLSLPVIWYLLRTTPPSPAEQDLPSLALLKNIEDPEEVPARTPWWVLLLRLSAAALACLGLALPIYAPNLDTDEATAGPLLIVMDNDWISAGEWSEMVDIAAHALDTADRDTEAHLLLTAPSALTQDPAEALSRNDLDALVRTLRPLPWRTDRDEAADRLLAANLTPSRILWLSNGLDPDTAAPFLDTLTALAPVSVHVLSPDGPVALTGLTSSADGVALSATRAESSQSSTGYISALTADGAALATAEIAFEAESTIGEGQFGLPPAALSEINRFQISGGNSAGSVWLWDSTNRTRRVGLVSGEKSAQPLLSDMHYIRRALEPFATITEGDLATLINDSPDAIILTDIGQISLEARNDILDWVESGGALIRFAGPRLAARGDDLVPTPLRSASRAIGGALTWESPQPLGPFPETSPFAGLAVPADVTIKQQVLARPGPELAQKTWARLADGSPLVTAAPRGDGVLILFHVTAGPDWSSLPYSGLFVEMLRRSIAAGKGEVAQDETGLYSPVLSLNGQGRLGPALTSATPLEASAFADTDPSELHPPGLYRGPAGTRALNAAAGLDIAPITDWPSNVDVLGDADVQTDRLGGQLLAAAVILLLIDLLVALSLAGRLKLRHMARVSAAILICGLVVGLTAPALHAQTSRAPTPIDQDKDVAAALKLRLAYIRTGDSRTDDVTRAGLEGLSMQLFRRSSVEPAQPHALNPETDPLALYPVIFLGLSSATEPLSEAAIEQLNIYLRNGGALFVDTRSGDSSVGQDSFSELSTVLDGIDTPPLTLVPQDHVLTRSFYLLDGFAGRYGTRPLWIEATGVGDRLERRGDGVSRFFIGDADYLAAWAIDPQGRPLFSVDGGRQDREMSIRFGINLVIYVLTGNYKEDQVHLPALLERLENGLNDPFDIPTEEEPVP